MNNRFKNYIESASANKANFDHDLQSVKTALQASIEKGSNVYATQQSKTGWLKGSLSYPWVLVCSIVPTIKEIF